MLKATREHTKNHNNRLVLRTIYEQQPVSRADIARLTGLTRPTVSSIVSDLIDESLVTETGVGPSAGGKPPVMLEINTEGWNILSVDIGSNEFYGALVDLDGQVEHRIKVSAENTTGATAVGLLYTLLDQLYAASDKPIIGFGIGSPGLIDPSGGVIRHSVNLGWNDLPLKDMLTARFEEPVFLANDSQAAALGEFMFGGPRESSNLLLIRLGKGIGAGIVLNNKLYYGDGFGAGEIGHVVLGESAGDTLEARVSSVTLLRQARGIAGADLSWDAFVDAVLNDDPALTEIVQSASDSLGMMVANLIAAFNIHNIVLSGPVSMFGDTLLDRTYQSAARRTLPLLAEKTTLISSSLGDDLVILGCSALVLQQELGVI